MKIGGINRRIINVLTSIAKDSFTILIDILKCDRYERKSATTVDLGNLLHLTIM